MNKLRSTAMKLGFALVTITLAWPEAEYIGADACKICHNKATEGAPYKKWTETKHAHAFELLQSDAAKQVAAKVGLTTPPHESAECIECHVTGYDPATKSAPAKILPILGVQCETCHGPGSEHAAEAKKYQLTKGKPGAVLPTLFRLTKDACVKCHRDGGPTWDPERFTLPDGTKAGFDFEFLYPNIDHPNPLKPKKPAE